MVVSRRTRGADRALRAVVDACCTASVLLLALLAVLVVAQVVGRNMLNLGLAWADELARFAGIAAVFLTVPLLALRGQHVAVDLVPQALPPGPRRAMLLLADLSVLAFAALSLYGLQSFLGRAGRFTTPALGLSNWVFYAPVVIGYLLLAAAMVARIAGGTTHGAAAEDRS